MVSKAKVMGFKNKITQIKNSEYMGWTEWTQAKEKTGRKIRRKYLEQTMKT